MQTALSRGERKEVRNDRLVQRATVSVLFIRGSHHFGVEFLCF